MDEFEQNHNLLAKNELEQPLVPLLGEENISFEITSIRDGVYTDPFSQELEPLTPIERLIAEKENESDSTLFSANIRQSPIARGRISTRGRATEELTGANANNLISVSPESLEAPVNEIQGTRGRDQIEGTDGNDRITGGFGADTIRGNAGNDIYVYESIRDAGDIILDFELNKDKIDLSAVLSSIGYQGDSPITDGYVTLTAYDGGTMINLDADGAGGRGSRAYIRVQGVTPDELASNPNHICPNPEDTQQLSPEITVPGEQSVAEDESLTINGIGIADEDGSIGTLEVSLSVNNGVVSLGQTAGLTFTSGDGSEDRDLVFSGDLVDLNTALDSLVYQGDQDFNGNDSLSITVTDLGDTTLTDSDSIAIAVTQINDAPLLNVPEAQTVAEDENLNITGISVRDIDSSNLEITMTVVNGGLSLSQTTGLTFTVGHGTEDSTLTFSGLVEDVNNALAGLVYRGNSNFNGDDVIVFTVSDRELEDIKTIPITVTPINDAPVLTVPETQTVAEDEDLNITGISISDLDVGNENLEVTVSTSNGVISLGQIDGLTFTNGDGTLDANLVFTGTLADINNAIATIIYRGNPDFNGDDTITIAVNDLGNTGAGGNLIDEDTIPIVVTPVEAEDIILLEGSNFRVAAQETITIPSQPSVLRFTYSELIFDTSDTDFINDGFEVALVDSNGNTLVHTIVNNRDAFFNITEGEGASLANGVTLNGQTVTVNLVDLTPGTEANLIFRLVNNDDDVATTVKISDIEVVTAAVTSPGGVTPDVEALAPAETINFDNLEDVSGSFIAEYQRTSFNEKTDILYIDVAIKNQGQYLVDAPLIVVVKNLSNTSVQVLDADGFTPEGLPYFDFTSLVNDGTLDPNEITESRTISFLNPNGVQFDYDLTFLGNLNQAPEFTSEPKLEAIVGKQYTYDADAIDADDDTLTYSLSVAPEGMTIDGDTGAINWSPIVGEEGTYNVIVIVEDGRGGIAEQNYTISAITPPPNRPPVITSAPVISGNVGTDYNYPVIATDPDGDTLTYAVTQAPEGLAIDEDTGEITWNPNSEQVGTNDVIVEVTDEAGATANQSYQIVVAQALDNNPPVIVSDPITQVNIDRREFGNPEPIDLSSWSPIFYSGNQGRAQWEIQPDTNNNVVLQRINAAPSVFIGDFELVNNKVEGTWKVDTSSDDDLIGFVFGYQDSQNFYLFDWKQGSQSDPIGFAEIGMNVKVVTADTPPTDRDFWPTAGVEGRVRNIFENDIGWEDFVEYGFSLEFLPGQFTITVTEEETGTVLESVTLEDDTFTDGGFGFYNYSQGFVEYSGFALQSLPRGDYLYDVDAIDPDDDVVSYELIDAPSGVEIDPDTGEVTWNPTQNDVGTYDITVAAKDDKGGVDTQTYELEVTDREVGAIEGTIFSELTDNPNPIAQANVDVYLDTNNNGVLDPNEPTQTTAVDNPNTLNIDETGQYRFNNLVNGTYTVRQIVPSGFEQITPENDAAYTVVIDAEQTVSNRNFTNRQTGELVNIAPTITSEAITEAEAGREYRYQVTATDPNPDVLTFDLPVKPQGMEINPDTGLIIWNPQQGRSGELSVVARVRDGQGGVDLQTFNLNLVPPNFDPVIISNPPSTAGVEVPLAYQVIALDDVSDTLTYALDNAPAGASIDPDTGLLTWTPASGQVGNSDFTVLVTDDRGASTTQTFTIETVTDFPNNDPVITSTPRTVVRVEDTYQYQIDANDPESEPLSYTLDNAPAGMTVSETGLIEWVTTPEQFGDNAVTLTVSDTRGGTAQQSFNIEVVSEIVNRNPVFESEPPRVVIAGETLIYNPTVTDPDGDRLTFYSERIFNSSDPLGLEADIPNISEETPGFSINPDTGEIRWNPSFEDLGIVQIALSASDPYGGITTQVFDLEVTAGNRPPLITSVPETQTAVGDNYAYGIAAEDPDGNAVTLNLEQAPAGMTLDGNILTWQPEASQLGNAEVIISATDEFSAVTTQQFTVVVADILPNRPPIITSTPDRVATPGELYQYAVTATDPEGETLTYTVENAPDGLTINENTGLIQWTPTAAQVGATEIIVNAIDLQGARSRQTFSLVVDLNDAPVINSTPVTTIDAGLTYQYDLQATDSDGERLTYTLLQAPEGMIIDSLGRIAWETDGSDVGTFDIEVAVSDPRGATVNQTYQLEVTADTEAPVINLLRNNTVVDIGSSVIFQVNASDNVGVEELSLTVDGVPVALDARGQASVTIDSFGEINAISTATDAAGNISTDTATVTGIDSSDVDAPFLDITSISDGDILTAPTDIIGTVNDDNLVSYSLSVAPLAGGEFIEIASGTNPVVDGEIANFDTSLLQNDTYRLRLTATDVGANTSTIEREVSIEGELKLGNFQLSFVDLTIPVSGIPITVARTYDTLNANERDDFGFGWSLGIVDTNLKTSVPRSGSEASDIYNPFEIGTRVYVTNPSTGRREGFTFNVEPPSRFNVFGTVKPRFIPDAGVTSTLSVAPAELVIAPNRELFSFAGGGFPYNPASGFFGGGYTLTTKEGIRFDIDGNTGDVDRVRDRNDNILTFTDAGILSSTGESVTFERDAQNRITAVIDPAGERIEYGYDANGDLVSVTDREGNTTNFEYSEERSHYLDEVIDPLGNTGARSEYNEQGRLIKLFDANGNPVELIHDPENSIETVIDPLGNSTQFIYDDRGKVVTEIDAEGGVTQRTYDDPNNPNLETSITDPNGNTTTFTYDNDGNVLTETDPEGNVTTNTYDRFGNVLTSTDPLGNSTQFIYDSQGNLTSSTDAAGNTTTYTYDENGNQTSITDELGQVTQFEYDNAGNITRETKPSGDIVDFTYDANGNLVSQSNTQTASAGSRTLTTTSTYNSEGQLTSVTNAGGNTNILEYDALGNMVARTDALGNTIRFVYDDRSQLIETIYPDSTPNNDADNPRTRSDYDLAGRLIAEVDELGRKTQFVYDKLGRRTETIFPDNTPNSDDDNPRTRTEYDPAGRIIAEIDERGNRTEFVYDRAGRQIETILPDDTPEDSSDNPRFTNTYDDAGRQTTQTDPLGNVTKSFYDSLGRTIRQEFADGTTISSEYDEIDRLIASTDQDGEITRYEYDALDRLSTVIDALGQRTEYGYDEQGNLITQKDANGNITQYEYDGLGRLVATELAEGQRSTTEYDAVGNIISTTDFNGDTITYEYDERDRLISENFPDGRSTTYTYTLVGQRASVTDTRGTTTYEYDAEDFLIKRIDPDGTEIAYTYDDAGNRTSVEIASGNTAYTYDELNRLQTVINPDGGITSYAYNDNSNLSRTEFANGTVETRKYDSLNRLTYIETQNVNGDVISSFLYELDAEGNRTQVTEHDGRIVRYTYDELDRLEKESIFDPGATAATRTIEYAYDNVGNRLSRIDSAEGTTIYTYDSNDRLLTETTDGVATTYTYDDNGNTISKTTGTDTVTYGWDAENRLVSADTDGDGTIDLTNQYNADGVRVAQTVNGEETRFLIDTNRPYAQVLEEYTPGGIIKVSYVHGKDLISQDRSGERTFYHVDHLGSTRALSDENGLASDRYIYDAFGQVLIKIGDTENSYLYAGEQRDSNLGLDYLRARYLDVNTGRFVSRDSFDGFLENPLSLNRYIYGNANPISNIDPSGKFSVVEIAVAGAIGLIALAGLNAAYNGILNYARKIGDPAYAKSSQWGINVIALDKSNSVYREALKTWFDDLGIDIGEPILTFTGIASLADNFKEFTDVQQELLFRGEVPNNLELSEGFNTKAGLYIREYAVRVGDGKIERTGANPKKAREFATFKGLIKGTNEKKSLISAENYQYLLEDLYD